MCKMVSVQCILVPGSQKGSAINFPEHADSQINLTPELLWLILTYARWSHKVCSVLMDCDQITEPVSRKRQHFKLWLLQQGEVEVEERTVTAFI